MSSIRLRAVRAQPNASDLRQPCGQHGTVGGLNPGIHRNHNNIIPVRIHVHGQIFTAVQFSPLDWRRCIWINLRSAVVFLRKLESLFAWRFSATQSTTVEILAGGDLVATNKIFTAVLCLLGFGVYGFACNVGNFPAALWQKY